MQFATSALFAIASASLVASASLPLNPRITGPLAKRAAAEKEDIDTVILNYALTLEHLKNAFYRDTLPSAEAFSKAGYPKWVRERFIEIGGHESSHVDFLTKALGDQATAECKYNFGVTSPKSFIATSALLEGVGVSAYLGAAHQISNPAYLTAAGSILTTEARHAGWVQSSVAKGDAFPAPYDTPAGSFSQVYSLAAPLITSCPDSNPKLPVTAFPSLKASPAAPVAGTQLTLTAEGIKDGQYLGFIGAAGATHFVEVKNKKATIPKDIGYGRIYAILVKNNKAITDDATIAGPIAIDIPLSPASKAAALYQ